MRTSLAAVTAALSVVVAGCGVAGADQEARFCAALGEQVPGMRTITWDNGFTRSEATWETLLEDGILRADEGSRRQAAVLAELDVDGFAAVLDAAPESLRDDLRLLHDALVDPDRNDEYRRDPAVTAAVDALRAAAPPEVCGRA